MESLKNLHKKFTADTKCTFFDTKPRTVAAMNMENRKLENHPVKERKHPLGEYDPAVDESN